MKNISLEKIDPAGHGPDKEETEKKTFILQERLYESLYKMFAEGRRSLLIVLQGIDASGKDGVVKHIFSGANPQGLSVASFKEPSAEDLAHDFLWRCHRECPARGRAVLFNRSYYEEVTTVKVHPDLLKAQALPSEILDDRKIFEKRFAAINEFERMLHDNGTVVVKFFLHISKAEQKERLQDRKKDPHKHWKFSQKDLKERQHWKKYMKAFEESLSATHTSHAPWTIIPADKKWRRNFLISQELVRRLDKLKMEYPKLR